MRRMDVGLMVCLVAFAPGCAWVAGIEELQEDPRDRNDEINGCTRYGEKTKPFNGDGAGISVLPNGFSDQCIRRSASLSLLFHGSKPRLLKGGDVWNGIGTEDPTNPINQASVVETESTWQLEFTLPAGETSIPFYLDRKPEAIPGAIFVQ